jgi:hypothetical protein
MPRPPAHEQADSARRRMHKDRLPRTNRIGTTQERLDGKTFEHNRSGRRVIDEIGQFDNTICGYGADLDISTRAVGKIGDAVANLEVVHAGADILNVSGSLHAEDQRKALIWITSATVMDVDEIDAYRRLSNAHLILLKPSALHCFVA